MIKTFGCFLLLLGLAAGHHLPARAADQISQRAWFEDKTGALSPAQAKQQTFTPFQSVLSRGVSANPIWVRLRIESGEQTANGNELDQQKLYLKISPVYLDQVELFDPADTTGQARITGDRYPVRLDEFRTFRLGFLIAKDKEPRDIYLRIQTTSTRFLHVEALQISDLLESERRLVFFSSVFLGISVLLLTWGLVSWLITREHLLLFYILSQIAGLAFGMNLLGHFRYFFGEILSPATIDYATSISAVSAVFTAICFYWQFYRDFAPPRWSSFAFLAAIGVEGVALGLIAIGEIRLAVTTNWLVISIVPIFCFFLVFFCKGWSLEKPSIKSLLPRKALFIYFGAILGTTFVAALGGLGVLESGRFTIYSGLSNTMLSGIIAFAVLQYRATINQKTQAKIATELTIAKETAKKEREHRLDQDRLLTMLAHELKTPLSVISVSLGIQNNQERNRNLARRAVSDMRDIIDQCLEADRLKANQIRVHFQTVSFSEVLDETCRRLSDPQPQDLIILGQTKTRIKTDSRLLRMILFNLLENALRYRAKNTPVTLEISDQKDSLICVRVLNHIGPFGSPDPQRLFDKYYRSAGAFKVSGTGLGLYLSKELAQKLGGTLNYYATESIVEFALCLPATPNVD